MTLFWFEIVCLWFMLVLKLKNFKLRFLTVLLAGDVVADEVGQETVLKINRAQCKIISQLFEECLETVSIEF